MIYYFLNKRWQFIVNGQVKLKEVEIYQLVYNGLQMQKKRLGSRPKNRIGRVSGIWIYNLLNFFYHIISIFFFFASHYLRASIWFSRWTRGSNSDSCQKKKKKNIINKIKFSLAHELPWYAKSRLHTPKKTLLFSMLKTLKTIFALYKQHYVHALWCYISHYKTEVRKQSLAYAKSNFITFFMSKSPPIYVKMEIVTSIFFNYLNPKGWRKKPALKDPL